MRYYNRNIFFPLVLCLSFCFTVLHCSKAYSQSSQGLLSYNFEFTSPAINWYVFPEQLIKPIPYSTKQFQFNPYDSYYQAFQAERYMSGVDPMMCPSGYRYHWAILAGLPPDLFTNTLWLSRIYNLDNTFQLYPQYSIGKSYGEGFGAIGYSGLTEHLPSSGSWYGAHEQQYPAWEAYSLTEQYTP
jgi:hypothetical protein